MDTKKAKPVLDDLVSLSFCFLLAVLAWLYWHFLDQKGFIILMLLPVPLLISRVVYRFRKRHTESKNRQREQRTTH